MGKTILLLQQLLEVQPPKNTDEVDDPPAPPCLLAVDKSFTSVQELLSQDSVFANFPGDGASTPPIIIAVLYNL